MEADKENTSSSYLQTSFQSPSAANYDRCNTGGVGRSKTMRLLTSGMGTPAAESEVILIFIVILLTVSVISITVSAAVKKKPLVID